MGVPPRLGKPPDFPGGTGGNDYDVAMLFVPRRMDHFTHQGTQLLSPAWSHYPLVKPYKTSISSG